ncbi:MAG: phage/plasmid primase, P4 family [Thermoplasmataceae archaeon]|jgi:putative DNA primase/helicase
MSSTVSPPPNSVKQFIEQFKASEIKFTRKVDSALYFAGKGIGVFQLHTVKNGICTCMKGEGCKSPGKHPLHKNWQNEATTESDRIKRMWLANPNANIGLAMGNGLIGIDIDVKNGKDGWKEWLKILEECKSEHIVSLIQATPSGGLHIILKVNDSSVITGASDGIATGIDVRSDGNLLVGGLSENVQGIYMAFDLPIVNAPDWLESLLVRKANWVNPLIRRIQTGAIFNQGERNKSCLAYSTLLNRQGCTKEEFKDKMMEFAKSRCSPPYEDAALDYMIEHYYSPTGAANTDAPTFIDLGNPNFKIWEVSDDKVKEALTALYEYVSQGPDETYELARRNLPNILMQYIKHRYHVTRGIAFGKPQDTLFWYNGKFYETEPTNWLLREKLELLTSNHIAESEKNEIINKLMDTAYKREEQERYLALDNVLFDSENARVLDFTTEIFATLHLPVTYDKGAKTSIFEKFLSEVANEEDIPRLQEWAGYTLIPGYPIKKGFIAIGPTDSGKSTFLLTVKEILGITNVSSATLQQLSKADQRFITSKLYKKLANIAPDMPSTSVSDVSIFKGITGRDLIPGEFKYKHPFDFQPRSKLLFSANSLPPVGDDEDAFFNRWDIVVFHKPSEIDTRLQEKLKTEASGILNWMIEGARRIINNGLKFSNSTPTVQAMRIWERSANPVKAFYFECIVKEGEEERPASDYYAAFRRYAEIHHLKVEEEDIFDVKFSKASKTKIITHQKNNVPFKFRKGLVILPEETWSDSGTFSNIGSTEIWEDPSSIYETVKKTFLAMSKSARERDNVERWTSSEFRISLEKVHSMIEDWISRGVVLQNGRCLEFTESGDVSD